MNVKSQREPATSNVSQECRHEKVSVVIATLGRRVEMTRRMLEALGRQSCRNFDITIVLNGEGSPDLERMVREFPVRLLKTPIPGQSRGQNLGIRESDGSIVIPTDDDIIPSDDWVHQLLAPFNDAAIGCVTGRFETGNPGFFRLDRVYSERAMSRWTIRPSDPNWVDEVLRGDTGIAANSAYRREVLLRCGLLPEDLSGGTAIDTIEGDIYLKVLKLGFALNHNPDAIVTLYFDDPPELQRERLYSTRAAAVALYLKLIAEQKGLRWQIAKSFFASITRVAARKKDVVPAGHVRLTATKGLFAYLHGVSLYLRSGRRTRQTEDVAAGAKQP